MSRLRSILWFLAPLTLVAIALSISASPPDQEIQIRDLKATAKEKRRELTATSKRPLLFRPGPHNRARIRQAGSRFPPPPGQPGSRFSDRLNLAAMPLSSPRSPDTGRRSSWYAPLGERRGRPPNTAWKVLP